ncbi:MAG: LbetaH domain-containing protein [Candidatus Methanofastidiosia archaeon]
MIAKNPKTSWKESSMPKIDPTSSIAPTASVVGNVTIGKNVNVAPGASIRSDEGESIEIGENSNVQDNVVIHCLKGGKVVIGKEVSLAHCAVIHGPIKIKDSTFVGFGSIVASSSIGKNAFISHNATVLGVNVPEGKYVPPATLVQTQKEADNLAFVPDNLKNFNEEVVGVNCELARGYLKEKN